MKITNRFKSKIYITVIRIGEIVLVFIDLLLFILIVFSYFIYVLLINLRLNCIYNVTNISASNKCCSYEFSVHTED